MAKSSINFQKVSIHSFKHNDRSETKTAETVYKELSNKNEFDIDAKVAQENFDELYKIAMKKIQGKTRRADKKNTLVEAVVNIKTNTTMQDLKELQKHIEKEFGFQGLQIAIHRDEGHYEDDTFITNNHAHMSFFTLNRETGRQMFRREHINKDKLRDLQTTTANILVMDRGTDKRVSKTERLGHKEYKSVKKTELAKGKDLDLEVKKLREELQELKAERKDHAKLEQLNRDLKDEVKNKTLTIEDLNEHMQSLKQSFLNSKKENTELQKRNEKLEKNNTNNEDLIQKYEFISDSNSETIRELRKELDDKSIELEEKNVSRPNMDDYDYKKEVDKIVNDNLEEKEFGTFKKETVVIVKDKFSFTDALKHLASKGSNYLLEQYKKLESKYNDLKDKYSNLEKENGKLKNTIFEMKDEIYDLKKKLTSNSLNGISSSAMKEIKEDFNKTQKENTPDFLNKNR